MSLKKFFNNLREVEVDIAWCHWNRLGATGRGKINKCSTDPEALILLTSIIGQHELRLVEVMTEWLDNYESLVSVERLKGYIKILLAEKETSDDRFNILRDAISNRDIKRWRSVAELIGKVQKKKASTCNLKPSRKKLEIHDKIIKDNRQLFLRLMFGVGSRADVIYYSGVVWNQDKNPFSLQISAPSMTRMLHYNNSSIFRTICDLERAGALVIDQKTISGKNKVYLPNTQFRDAKDIFGIGAIKEKSFVDWFGVAKLCLTIEALSKKLEGVEEESIIKSRLSDFMDICTDLMNEACIDSKHVTRSNTALKLVPMNDLLNSATMQIQSAYDFLT